MWKYLLLGILSSSAFGSNLSLNVGLGYGMFDDLSVPYALGSYSGLDPRADGSNSRLDVTRRRGLGIQASLASREQFFEFISVRNEFYIFQISGFSGMGDDGFTSASFDKIGIKSLGQYSVAFWPLLEINAGFGVQRMDWRNISTGHLLDTLSLSGGLSVGRFQYVQLSLEAEQALAGRFAWDNHLLNLAPKTMKDVGFSDRRLGARLSYLRLKRLVFNLEASQQLTKIKFRNLQQNYAESGLEVNPFLPSVQNRILNTTNYSFGFERTF